MNVYKITTMINENNDYEAVSIKQPDTIDFVECAEDIKWVKYEDAQAILEENKLLKGQIAELKKHKEWNNIKVNSIEVSKIKADAIRELRDKTCMKGSESWYKYTVYTDNLEKDDEHNG